jgi:hypothetical protein
MPTRAYLLLWYTGTVRYLGAAIYGAKALKKEYPIHQVSVKPVPGTMLDTDRNISSNLSVNFWAMIHRGTGIE